MIKDTTIAALTTLINRLAAKPEDSYTLRNLL